MCGIVGFIGNEPAENILLTGLKRLEYRGYDSAGIATLDEKGKPTLTRSVGKLVNLESVLPDKKDKIGIGHTRWATHGIPVEKNSHPHYAGDIYLVHNGIIENYQELKKDLEKEHEFTSDTDSEVLAALINHHYKKTKDLKSAVEQAVQKVRGTYGIATISTKNPDEIIVARLGSPIIIGIGQDFSIIASDASALLGRTKDAIYLNDGEIATCTAGKVALSSLTKKSLSPKIEKIETDLTAIQKQGYDHFLLKEIIEQSDSLRRTLSGRINPKTGDIRLGGLNLTEDELRKTEHILIIGCGTAYHAGLLASYYLEQLVPRLTIEVAVASEFRYRAFHLPKNTIAFFISQSGETADTLACLREVKNRGIKTLGIINSVGSTIAREVDGGTYVHAGPEISVASTKAFTCQIAALLILGGQLAKIKGGDIEKITNLIKELDQLPAEIEKAIKSETENLKKLAKKYNKYDHAFYLGRDTAYPIALEAALKLKEISYIDANGYPAGELKHGPLALVDDRFFNLFIIPDNWLFDKTISALHEVQARNGKSIVFTNSKTEIENADIIRLKTKLNFLSPILLNVLGQLFAYYVTVEKGLDVDQPRNLAKSVTVE